MKQRKRLSYKLWIDLPTETLELRGTWSKPNDPINKILQIAFRKIYKLLEKGK